MDYRELDSFILVELAVSGDKKAYFEFFQRHKKVFETVYSKNLRKILYCLEFKEFLSFSYEWVLVKKKLHSLHRKLTDSEGAIEDRNEFIKRYFYSIVNSAFFAYLHESFPEYRLTAYGNYEADIDGAEAEKKYLLTSYDDAQRALAHTSDDLLDRFSIDSVLEQEYEGRQIDKFLMVLNEYPRRKRISLWLVYLARAFPLPEEDIEWLAELNNCSTMAVRNRIDEGIEANSGRKFSLSSGFVGELLKEKSNSVTVRNKRFIATLKARFSEKTGVDDA